MEGIKFYNQLYTDKDFCLQLGKVMLSASRLESELIRYLSKQGVKENTQRANLGKLIRIAENNNLLVKIIPVLKDINGQRNYFSHNLHALFTGLIDETILTISDLLDADINLFTDRAIQLEENLAHLANIIAKYNENSA